MIRYYFYYGDAGFAGTSTYGFVKVEGETGEKCDKDIQYYIDNMTESLQEDYSYLIDYPDIDDYDDEDEYNEAFNEAVKSYQEDTVCYYEDITDNIVNGIAFRYAYNICSTAVMEPEDFDSIVWEEI